MDIVGYEGGLQPAKERISHDRHRHEEDGRHAMHTRQGINSSRATGDQHERNEDVRHQSKYHEGEVRRGAVPRADNLKKRMSIRSSLLELDGQCREENHLTTRSAGVPEGA